MNWPHRSESHQAACVMSGAIRPAVDHGVTRPAAAGSVAGLVYFLLHYTGRGVRVSESAGIRALCYSDEVICFPNSGFIVTALLPLPAAFAVRPSATPISVIGMSCKTVLTNFLSTPPALWMASASAVAIASSQMTSTGASGTDKRSNKRDIRNKRVKKQRHTGLIESY